VVGFGETMRVAKGGQHALHRGGGLLASRTAMPAAFAGRSPRFAQPRYKIRTQRIQPLRLAADAKAGRIDGFAGRGCHRAALRFGKTRRRFAQARLILAIAAAHNLPPKRPAIGVARRSSGGNG